MKYSDCDDCAIRIAWIGVFTSMILALLKYYIGWVGGSAGVMAGAIHSTTCMISSGSILFAHAFSKKDADDRFHYGYGKVEFVLSAVVSLSILIILSLFLISNLRVLMTEVHHIPHVTTVVIAAASIIINETLYRHFICAGKQTNSSAVTAAAWAVRSDALTSLVVLIGVIGASLNIKHLDPVIAIGISIILFKTVGTNLINSARSLMDYSADDSLARRIKPLMATLPSVLLVKHIKTRPMGQHTKVDIELQVAPSLTVSEISQIESDVIKLIKKNEKKIGDISVDFFDH